MTYDARELSMQSGEPIEMYQFTVGATNYYFTSAKSAITYSGNTYQPEPIKRGSIDFTTEKGRNNLKLQTVRDFAIADLFRVSPPSDVILLVVHRVHYGETDGSVIWSGRVLNCDWVGSIASLNCEPVSSSLQRIGLRRMYQRQCPHVLYGSACGVDKTDFDLSTTILSISGLTLSCVDADIFGDDWFAGGFIEFGTEKRFITTQTSNNITISAPIAGLEVGDTITAYAGCNHALTTCNFKFSNSENYGGMPYIPTKNPFSGSLL